jgi:ATP-binding cassette subfamily B protein
MLDKTIRSGGRGGAPAGPGIPGRPGPFGGRGDFGRRGMPVEKPKNFWPTVSRLWTYFGGERRHLFGIFLLIVLSSCTGLSVPYLIGRVVNVLAKGKGAVDLGLAGWFVLVLLAVYVCDTGINFLQNYFLAGVSQRIVKHLRRALFDKLQKLPISFFDSRTHGELMSRFTNDIENVSSTISQATMQLMAGSLAVVGSLVMMLALNPLLTLASIVTVPLVIACITIITRKTQPLFRDQQATLGRLNGHIEETMSGMHVVKAFGREEWTIDEFERHNARLRDVGMKAQIWSGYIMPLMNVINNIGFAAVAGVGGILAVRGMATVGVIASFLGYSRQFSRPLNDLSAIYNMLQSAVAGAERVFEILDEKQEPVDPPGAIALDSPLGHVVFDNVSFGYRSDVPVLSDIAFEAEAGSTMALVGPTGAGKTTIVNLLARFYDVSQGRILIDGRDIREYTRDSLRRCFGIVLQDAYLFSGTIRENIRYGRLGATDAEVESAATMARADQFIRRLPRGYETVLAGSDGLLSQGERQLLTIARAILADPRILILDEATSSVDTRTEVHIQEAMRSLMKGRTSFIIAHRLSTIRDADSIMVIDRGRIIEKGRHRDLLDANGFYRTMYMSQFANIPEPEAEKSDVKTIN